MTDMFALAGTVIGNDIFMLGVTIVFFVLTIVFFARSIYYLTKKYEVTVIRMARRSDGVTVLGIAFLFAAIDAIAFAGFMGWSYLQILIALIVIGVIVVFGLVRWHQYWFRLYLAEARRDPHLPRC
jgi:hypothetical protein